MLGGLANLALGLRILLAVVGLGIALLAAIAPLLQSALGPPSGESIYALLGKICHQYPSRSPWIADRPFALCARCFGGWLGVALGGVVAIAAPRIRMRTQLGWGAVAVALGVADPLLQILGGWPDPWQQRLVAGVLGGIGLALLLTPIPRTPRSFGIERNESCSIV